MDGGVKGPRRYDSSRRRAQAAATRRDILAAAQRLFVERGYVGTTMADVAGAAGVALKTVYLAFETKAGVLRALWHLLLRGDDDDAPVGERAWYLEVLAERDPHRRLRLNARNSTARKRDVAPVLEVIRTAAPSDPEIAALWSRIQSEYHTNQRAVVEPLHEAGQLAPSLDVDTAADVLWAINHPDTWQLLVVQRRWPPERYEQWSGDAACALLLAPTSAVKPRRPPPARS